MSFEKMPPNEEMKDSSNSQEVPTVEKFPLPDAFLRKMEKNGFFEHAETYKKVIELAEIIRERGGKALLVGGGVRDFFMGKISKDFDIEVYGLEANKIEEAIQPIGTIMEVGKAFGILKIRTESGLEIDVSLPRTDSKIDAGHRGFEVKTDPHMSVAEAARRRDFTMNSMAADPLSGDIFDPFDGREDIKKRILRVTDPERFVDDPARVLRAIQFVGRFGMEIEKESAEVIRELVPKLKEEPKERIGEEWKKLLLKSEKPSLGLNAGMNLGVFNEIHPELPPLAQTEQDPEWHPEGDVWIHTLMVVDEAAKIVNRESLEDDQKLSVLLSSLCHDFGKPAVTELRDNRIKSHGHEQAGEEPTKKFLSSIGIDFRTRDKVVKLVTNHLIPTTFYIEEKLRGRKVKDSSIRRLAERIHPANINDLTLLAEADHLGRGSFDPEIKEQMFLPREKFPARQWLLKRAAGINAEMGRPADVTRGRDWINLGFRPGSEIGQLIRLSNELRDEKNLSREEILNLAQAANNAEEATEILLSRLGKK